MVAGNPETVPLLPAGHKLIDSEMLEITNLLGADGVSGGLWAEQVFLRNADQTFAASTTLTNDNVFSVPVLANAVYLLDGYFAYTSNATALMKGTWSLPSGASGSWDPAAIPSTVTTGQSSALLQQKFALNTTLTFGYGSSTSAFHCKGTLRVGATAGNAVWQFAQSVSNAVLTGMVTDSWLTARRIL